MHPRPHVGSQQSTLLARRGAQELSTRCDPVVPRLFQSRHARTPLLPRRTQVRRLHAVVCLRGCTPHRRGRARSGRMEKRAQGTEGPGGGCAYKLV